MDTTAQTTTVKTGTFNNNGYVQEWDNQVETVKKALETAIVLARNVVQASREQALVVTKLQEALHWLVYTKGVTTTDAVYAASQKGTVTPDVTVLG